MSARHLRLFAATLGAIFASSAPVAAVEPAPASRGERAGSERRQEARRVRAGPLFGVGFPRPIAIEAYARLGPFAGFGAEYSFLPRMSVFGLVTSFNAFAVDLRVFPFRNAFFVGVRAGRQWLDAKARIPAGSIGSFVESMSASTWFVNPRAGFLFTFGSGVTLGVDAGVQLPVSPTYERDGLATRAGLAREVEADSIVATVAGVLGNAPTPTIDLLRVGVLF